MRSSTSAIRTRSCRASSAAAVAAASPSTRRRSSSCAPRSRSAPRFRAASAAASLRSALSASSGEPQRIAATYATSHVRRRARHVARGLSESGARPPRKSAAARAAADAARSP